MLRCIQPREFFLRYTDRSRFIKRVSPWHTWKVKAEVHGHTYYQRGFSKLHLLLVKVVRWSFIRIFVAEGSVKSLFVVFITLYGQCWSYVTLCQLGDSAKYSGAIGIWPSWSYNRKKFF